MVASKKDQAKKIQVKIARLLKIIESRSDYHFTLEWVGDTDPIGFAIGGVGIREAHNGILIGTDGQTLGFYTREVIFGGEFSDQQRIRIFVNTSDVTAPENGIVKACARGSNRQR